MEQQKNAENAKATFTKWLNRQIEIENERRRAAGKDPVSSEEIGHAEKNFRKMKGGRQEGSFRYYMRDFALTDEDLNKKILDVAANTGDFVSYMREERGNKNVFGVELFEAKILPWQVDGMVAANATELPFGDETFEIVLQHNLISIFLAGNVDDAKRSISEALRVLKKGGFLKFDSVSPGNDFSLDFERHPIIREQEIAQKKGAQELDRWFDEFCNKGFEVERVPRPNFPGNVVITIQKQ